MNNKTLPPRTHNQPPDVLPFEETPEGVAYLKTPEGRDWKAFKERTDTLTATGNMWITERPEITDDDMSGKLADYLEQCRKELKALEETRRGFKKPHEDAAKLVDARFSPLAIVLKKIGDLLKPRQTKYLQDKQRRIEEERRAKEAAALKAIEEEEAAKKAASSGQGDVIGNAVAAEEAATRATRLMAEADAAPKRAAAKGDYSTRAMSLRTVWKARVADIDEAFSHFKKSPEVMELLTRLACAEARATKGEQLIPGCQVYPEQAAA